MARTKMAPDNRAIDQGTTIRTARGTDAMTAQFIALAALLATSGVAAGGLPSEGSFGVGLTIVSSCNANGINAYRAVLANGVLVADRGGKAVAACTAKGLSTDMVAPAYGTVYQIDRQLQKSPAGSGSGGVVLVTLTF